MSQAAHPLITVIVVARDTETFLDECLLSIVRQTYTRFEIVIVNDGSLDETQALAEEWASRDGRVRIHRNETPLGVAATRNLGIALAEGDYLCFVDSDDAVAPDFLERCVFATQVTGSPVVVFGLERFRDQPPAAAASAAIGQTIAARRIGTEEYLKLPEFVWTKFLDAALVKDQKLQFDPEISYGEDQPFHWSIGLLGAEAAYLADTLYYYRQRPGSITSSRGESMLDVIAARRMIWDLLRTSSRSPEILHIYQRRLFLSFWFVYLNIDKPLLPTAVQRMRLVAELVTPQVMPILVRHPSALWLLVVKSNIGARILIQARNMLLRARRVRMS